MTVTLSINLWTKYCVGVPSEVLFERPWYVDLLTFVKGESTFEAFLYTASNTSSTGNLVTGQTTINVPAKTLFVKGVQVYDSTSASTGANAWLEKKDETYLQEYIPAETSTGKPKYYAMFGGATVSYTHLTLPTILLV